MLAQELAPHPEAEQAPATWAQELTDSLTGEAKCEWVGHTVPLNPFPTPCSGTATHVMHYDCMEGRGFLICANVFNEVKRLTQFSVPCGFCRMPLEECRSFRKL